MTQAQAPVVIGEQVTQRRRLPRPAGNPFLHLVLIGLMILWAIPAVGLLVSSFRTADNITRTGWWEALLHPFEAAQWTINNYVTVIEAEGMGNAFLNSLIVTIPATAIPITVAAFAAYAFAWIRFPGRSLLFMLLVGLMVVPLQMALIPVLRLYAGLELNGTFLGVWLAHSAFGLPLAVFLLYNFISQLPRDLFETAAIDGASHFQVFTRIVLPLSVPALGAFAIFQFLWVWNDLLVALVFLGTRSDVLVMPASLSLLVGSRGEAWHVLTAGAFVTMLLPLAVFLLLQRAFVRGILAGSVKA
jgi:alpha-glucoside transport system permease protein